MAAACLIFRLPLVRVERIVRSWDIALAGLGKDGYDHVARVLRALGHLNRRPDRGAGGDAREDTFLFGQAAGHLHGILVLYGDDLVNDLGIENVGNEARADALDRMRAFGFAAQDRRGRRLNGDALEAGLARLDDVADARDGAAGADSGHQDIALSFRVPPYLFGGRAAMDFGVGRVLELLRDEVAARGGGGDLFRFADGARHSFRPWRQHQLRAEGAQQDAPLHRHGLRHDQRALIAFGRARKRQGDSGIAAGRLQDDGVRLDLPGALSRLDHRHADTVLDAAKRIEKLQLR